MEDSDGCAEGAGERAGKKISDPATRRRVFETVMWGDLHEPFAEVVKKAQDAMEKADFPDEWKTALRESLA